MLRNLLKRRYTITGKRNKWLRNAGILVMCTSFFGIWAQVGSGKELNHVVMSVWNEDRLYGVDSYAETNTVFVCDKDGKNRKKLVFDMVTSECVRIGESVFIGEDGRCYVIYQEYSQIQEIKYMIAVCNFEQGVLENPREIPPSVPLASDQYKVRQLLDEDLWYVNHAGSVWSQDQEGIKRCLFQNDGQKMDMANTAYCFGNDGLYFYHVENGIIYKISYATGVLEATDLGTLTKGMEGSLYYLNQMADGTFTAGFRDEEGRLFPAVLKEGNGRIEKIYPPLAEQAAEIVGKTVALVLGLLLLYLFYKVVFHLFGNIIPTPLKLFCYATLMVIAGSRIMTFTVYTFLASQILEKEEVRICEDTNTLAEMIQPWIFATNKEQINTRFLKTFNEYGETTLDLGDVFNVEKKSLGGVSAGEINYDLLLNYNEDFYMVNENSLYCNPSAYVFGEQASDYMKECEKQGGLIVSYDRDPQWGYNLVVYRPILDEGGNVYAVIRGISNKSVLNDRAQEATESIIKWVNLFLGITLILLTGITAVIMWPLLKLRRCAQSVEQGMEAGWKKKNGMSEVVQITQVFIQMLESIDVHLKKVRRIKQAYEPFVPENIIDIFGGKDIIDIQLGEKTSTSAVIVVLESEELKRKRNWEDSGVQFSIWSQIYCVINEHMEKAGGIVERFTEAGAVIIFRNETDTKGMNEILHAVGETVVKLNAAHIDYGGSICYFGGGVVVGELQLGIVGTEERMEVMVVSPHTDKAFALECISCQYKAGIIIVKQAAQEAVKAGEADHIRLFASLGMVGKNVMNEEIDEEIYEYFVPLGKEQTKLRAATKEDYEAGIQHLKRGEFREARNNYERVLRQNQDDLAAKFIFRLCDKKI